MSQEWYTKNVPYNTIDLKKNMEDNLKKLLTKDENKLVSFNAFSEGSNENTKLNELREIIKGFIGALAFENNMNTILNSKNGDKLVAIVRLIYNKGKSLIDILVSLTEIDNKLQKYYNNSQLKGNDTVKGLLDSLLKLQVNALLSLLRDVSSVGAKGVDDSEFLNAIIKSTTDKINAVNSLLETGSSPPAGLQKGGDMYQSLYKKYKKKYTLIK